MNHREKGRLVLHLVIHYIQKHDIEMNRIILVPETRKIIYINHQPITCHCYLSVAPDQKNSWLIRGFTISVSIFSLPVFRQLLLRNGKISSKYLFWNEKTQRADDRWQQQSYFTSTSINYSIMYFQIGIIFQLS